MTVTVRHTDEGRIVELSWRDLNGVDRVTQISNFGDAYALSETLGGLRMAQETKTEPEATRQVNNGDDGEERNRFLTLHEVADLVGLTPKALYTQRSENRGLGRLGFKVGHRVLFDAADIESWISEHRDAERRRRTGGTN